MEGSWADEVITAEGAWCVVGLDSLGFVGLLGRMGSNGKVSCAEVVGMDDDDSE